MKKVYSKVNFDGKTTSIIDDYKQNSSEDYSERELHFPSVYIETSQSIINILEDDPFDYDIVNIDNRLLTVPEVLSLEFLLYVNHYYFFFLVIKTRFISVFNV